MVVLIPKRPYGQSDVAGRQPCRAGDTSAFSAPPREPSPLRLPVLLRTQEPRIASATKCGPGFLRPQEPSTSLNATPSPSRPAASSARRTS
jgi:hypothetical protein